MSGNFYQSGGARLDMFSEQQPRANADSLMAMPDRINSSEPGKVWFTGQGTDNPW
ncbi:hypothetical protein [Pantoea agglomerans]|uniref:hypothetical protein n=1 Tax=Enterobacter agglomerans TaxID=549 RepID=UPI002413C049|nr:hypothetical protein [Pantoea agglomerans]